MRALHPKVVVVLGIAAAKGSKRNPFDFRTREQLLLAAYPDVLILPLRDCASDRTWSRQLDELLLQHLPGESCILYGSRDSFADAYTGQWPTSILPAKDQYCSSNIRVALGKEVLATEDFRMGINYACQNRYETVYPAVDIALLNAQHTQVLLGRKPTEDQWRLPGGFADTKDLSYEQAAARELQEECGNLQTSRFQYVGSCQVDDWRYRTEPDKIMTILFTTHLLAGTPTAGDDLAEVQWFDVTALTGMITEQRINTVHHPLISLLFTHLNK